MDVHGVRLHWTECGPASIQAPLVLLHGLGDSHLTWKRFAPILAARRRVLMPDAPGCGLSDRPDAPYTLQWHTDLITEWLNNLGYDKIDAVGHSYGGGVAQMLTLQSSLRIRRLGLIASGGLGPRLGFWLRLAAVPGLLEYLGQPCMGPGTRLALANARRFIAEEDILALSEMNAQPGTARALARTISDVVSWRGQDRQFFDYAHEGHRLPPIALFWGDCDDVTPIDDAREFARSVLHVELHEFTGSGHYLHHQQPEALARRLQHFLDKPRVRPARVPVTGLGCVQPPLPSREWAYATGSTTRA